VTPVVDEQLVERAEAEGVRLTGPGGLLGRLTKLVLENALEGEMSDHLGYEAGIRPAATVATPATAPGPRRC
jgi:putative transposase